MKNLLPPQLHLLSFYSVISHIAASRQLYGQPHTFSSVLQQGPVKDIAGILLQISNRFGVQAMPVSMSVPILLVASESTPDPGDYGPTFTNFQDTITEYKAMWGWDYVSGHEQQDLTGTTLIAQSDHHLLNFTAQDLLNATMHDDAQHGISATTGLGADSGQGLALHAVTSRQSDQVGMEMDLTGTSYLDDAAALGSDNPLADTPAQLRDYLALLQENESTGNNQDFMQSLGFFMDFDNLNS